MRALYFITILTFTSGLVNADGPTVVTGGGVQGVWTRFSSPYLIRGEVEVPPGAHLTIERDVKVQFEGPYALVVLGVLEVEGKSSDKVVFEGTDEGENTWRGLRFIKAEEPCRLQNFTVRYAGSEGQGGAIYAEETELFLTNFSISECLLSGQAAAMYFVGGTATLTNGALSENVTERDNGVIFAQGAEITMTNMAVSENTGIGVMLAQKSRGTLTNVAISEQMGEFGWGIFVAGSELILTNAAISENEAGGIRLKMEASATLTTCAISGPNALKQDESSEVNMVMTAVSDD